MKKIIFTVLITAIISSNYAWGAVDYTDPVGVAKYFLEALIDKDLDEINNYLIKKIRRKNHWVNLTKDEISSYINKWNPVEFRQETDSFGYVILNAPYGHIAIKFQKEEDKWLWASE